MCRECSRTPILVIILLIGGVNSQYLMYNPNANSGNEGKSNGLYDYGAKMHYGQPVPSSSGYEDPADAWEMTDEERQSKKQNPLPYIINPLIRRGTQGLGHMEAHANRDARRKAVLMPILNLVLNPSRRK